MSEEKVRFTRVDFTRFKAFERFRLDLRAFNVIVGPNNAGKSTIIAAFRILAEAMRRAESRKAEFIIGPNGLVHGHTVDLSTAFIAEENIFFEYEDDEPALIVFYLDNGNKLTLYFPEQGSCLLIPDAHGKSCASPKTFKDHFPCRIGFAPVLSPVDHYEKPFQREAARKALLNYQASRNFRNIWFHFPEKFDQFRKMVEETWPGMSVDPPEIGHREDETYLFMYCPEKRRPREIFWSGFGFQVWCQMLTHVIQSDNASIFLIDEPDVYLHSDLQRQLVGILKNLGPDILVATHSTEIISECDADEIVLVSKDRRASKRLRSPLELGNVFSILGSSANPVLTQLAKTRRVIFVEGLDFRIIGKFARKLSKGKASVRSDFAVVATDGFNSERIKALQAGMEHPLGRNVLSGAILDRDYRCESECTEIEADLLQQCVFATIHRRKEIENFVLIPDAIDRAVAARIKDRQRRGAAVRFPKKPSKQVLEEYCETKKTYSLSRFTEAYKSYHRAAGSRSHEVTLIEKSVDEFEKRWSDSDLRLAMVSGKEALSHLNAYLQSEGKISVTPLAIIDAMKVEEVPSDMVELIEAIETFADTAPP